MTKVPTNASVEIRERADDEIEVADEMIKAGEEVVWSFLGGAEGLGGYFSARELVEAVYEVFREFSESSKQY